MSVKDLVRPAYVSGGLIRSAYAPSRRPIVAVYGNCQAAALRTLLNTSDDFKERFNVVRLPGAHEISPVQLKLVQRVLARASVVFTQRIRNNYRGMQLGTDELTKHVRSGARILTYPSMFYRGLHPYLVYVHATGELGTPAPLTEGYHDLRFIYAASVGMSDSEAVAWLQSFSGASDFIASVADDSINALSSRDQDMDIPVSSVIRGLKERSFWTLNHPSNEVLGEAAKAAHSILGTENPKNLPGPQLLTSVVIPVHSDVREALHYPVKQSRMKWVVGSRSYFDEEVLAAHLDFYRARPEVLVSARHEHEALLARAGLSAGKSKA